ncbi:MAG: dihydropyrimidinase [Bacilli bacterium]|jgi:dihydropyrimidinase|nr:dihydropyrimidinase [Acholeplasmataceae bacterium]MDD3069169.1 dihydropyrimidinase [Bacilli bacterium]MDD4469157.1 dihydropyrimidinase [Acholeplasmataceae bacterium]
MTTLIKNGILITAYNEHKGDVLIDGEKIVSIEAESKALADVIIDASGKYVMPGGVDPHTHFSALCNVGNQDTAGYETTDAVVVGGTTTIVDYAPQDIGKGLLDSIKYRINVRAKDSCVDYALHAMITDVMDSIFDEIQELPRIGVTSIKCFMAYNGSPLHVDDGTLYKVLQKSKEYGITVFVHAENGEIIHTLQQDCVKMGDLHPRYHAVSRPAFVETEATRRAIYLAQIADTPIYIVHVTCKGAADAIKEAKCRGQKVMGETCTQYLTLDRSYLEQKDIREAAKYICSPALRDLKEVDALWDALNERTLNAVVSDHCGIGMNIKQYGLDNFTNIANGAPGAADRINMLWTEGVTKGRISKQTFVQIISTNPAKINGIYPQKGHIDIGSDADIMILDPSYKGTVRLADNPNGVDYNLYEGKELNGRVDTVLLRGKVVVEKAKFIGEFGQGRFVHSNSFGAAYHGLDDIK